MCFSQYFTPRSDTEGSDVLMLKAVWGLNPDSFREGDLFPQNLQLARLTSAIRIRGHTKMVISLIR